MEIRLTLQAGQNGTKSLVNKYGNRLICVRYRYDAASSRRYKTVELVESVSPWPANPSDCLPNDIPQKPCLPQDNNDATGERGLVNIGYEEVELREKARRAGGYWVKKEQAWSIPSTQIPILGLAKRLKK